VPDHVHRVPGYESNKADYLKRLPAKPGVYRMLGKDGEVLYVGKARSLKARVAQYARGRGHDNRITRFLCEVVRAVRVRVIASRTSAIDVDMRLKAASTFSPMPCSLW